MPDSVISEKYNALPDTLKTEVEHYIEFLLEKYTHNKPSQKTSQISEENPKKKRDGFGILKGKIWMSEDFDEPLEEMKEYM